MHLFGMSIKFGSVIHDSFLACIQKNKIFRLIHPTLIKSLCHRVSIKVDPIVELVERRVLVNVITIKNFKMWKCGQHEALVMGFLNPESIIKIGMKLKQSKCFQNWKAKEKIFMQGAIMEMQNKFL